MLLYLIELNAFEDKSSEEHQDPVLEEGDQCDNEGTKRLLSEVLHVWQIEDELDLGLIRLFKEELCRMQSAESKQTRKSHSFLENKTTASTLGAR